MAIANYVVSFTDINQVWFVVSPHNPLKEKKSLLPDVQRLRLVREAIAGDTRYKASNIEFNLTQPSYTINTLAYLQEKYPAEKFVLIIGSDNLQTFHKWKNYEQIIKQYELYVYPRPGFDGSELKNHPNVKWTQAPLMDISSTFIRDAIRSKKNINQYLPEGVRSYISEMKFYEK